MDTSKKVRTRTPSATKALKKRVKLLLDGHEWMIASKISGGYLTIVRYVNKLVKEIMKPVAIARLVLKSQVLEGMRQYRKLKDDAKATAAAIKAAAAAAAIKATEANFKYADALAAAGRNSLKRLQPRRSSCG